MSVRAHPLMEMDIAGGLGREVTIAELNSDFNRSAFVRGGRPHY